MTQEELNGLVYIIKNLEFLRNPSEKTQDLAAQNAGTLLEKRGWGDKSEGTKE